MPRQNANCSGKKKDAVYVSDTEYRVSDKRFIPVNGRLYRLQDRRVEIFLTTRVYVLKCLSKVI